MAIYRGINGVNKKILNQYVGVAGVNRRVSQQFKTVNGVSKSVFTKGAIKNYIYNKGSRVVSFSETNYFPDYSRKIVISYNSNHVLYTGLYGYYASGGLMTGKIDITNYKKIVAVVIPNFTTQVVSNLTFTVNITTSTGLANRTSSKAIDTFTNGVETKVELDISSRTGSYYISTHMFLTNEYTLKLVEWYLE